ncbi:MAG: hypothetical protein WCF28_02870 [Methanobacterium sp.]|uniref:hypothetical protein n=1 Tax=Methanobacterium sp. TaxID=2164 RepID=UPI003C708B80
MKNDFILGVVLILISILLIGSASASTTNTNIATHNSVTTATATNSVAVPAKTTLNTSKLYLIDSGANKFYWLERGGLFSYTWKTYRTLQGSVIINVNYKTNQNSWNGIYNITQVSKDKLKIVYTSPEVKLYTGHSSEVWYTTSKLTPVEYYLKTIKTQIKSDGYFFL